MAMDKKKMALRRNSKSKPKMEDDKFKVRCVKDFLLHFLFFDINLATYQKLLRLLPKWHKR